MLMSCDGDGELVPIPWCRPPRRLPSWCGAYLGDVNGATMFARSCVPRCPSPAGFRILLGDPLPSSPHPQLGNDDDEDEDEDDADTAGCCIARGSMGAEYRCCWCWAWWCDPPCPTPHSLCRGKDPSEQDLCDTSHSTSNNVLLAGGLMYSLVISASCSEPVRWCFMEGSVYCLSSPSGSGTW